MLATSQLVLPKSQYDTMSPDFGDRFDEQNSTVRNDDGPVSLHRFVIKICSTPIYIVAAIDWVMAEAPAVFHMPAAVARCLERRTLAITGEEISANNWVIPNRRSRRASGRMARRARNRSVLLLAAGRRETGWFSRLQPRNPIHDRSQNDLRIIRFSFDWSIHFCL